MSTQTTMTEAERAAIEKELTEMYKKSMEAMEKVDTSDWAAVYSDKYKLGFIDSGEFVLKSADMIKGFTEGYTHLERQELQKEIEFRLAVLAPDIVVGTDLTRTAAYFKDGKVFTGNFAHTMVLVKIDGEWKVIHTHQSVHPVEE
jgi:ketosteroid isomerase-like protein